MDQTQYMYEYHNGEKKRNIGFLKIDNQMDRSTIQIHARDMDEVVGILFRKPNGEIYIGTWDESVVLSQQAQEPRVVSQLDEPMSQESTTVTEMEEREEFITPQNITYEKIQRQDLSRLPRREWRIANNSFLLHGFYNYHHLLYIEEEGQVWIGVPGIYHEKEETAAKAFGFTDFRRLTDVNIKLEENEKNTYEDFGYWCRQILRS